MLDIHPRESAGSLPPVIRGVEFFRIELAPLNDGNILVSLTATTVDDEEPQLLDQEIARDRVTSIDAVLALIRTHVRVVPDPARVAATVS
jgi:hypothetical protein